MQLMANMKGDKIEKLAIRMLVFLCSIFFLSFTSNPVILGVAE